MTNAHKTPACIPREETLAESHYRARAEARTETRAEALSEALATIDEALADAHPNGVFHQGLSLARARVAALIGRREGERR